jgi:EAL domain-containing protein (putative c-di-GMP-specific phosphodiesterase class I)
VPPAEFIPLAETTGLIVQVGEWVLEAACAQAAVWQARRPAAVPAGGERLGARIHRVAAGAGAATLARYGLEPCWLELEITESTLMHDIDRVIGIMDRSTRWA